jgi:type I restriction enzyme S subunit
MVSQATGASYPAVSDKIVRSALIPQYSYEEQCRISGILDGVASIINKRKNQLNDLDDLIKARFVEMFGDPVINEKGWATKPFLEMGTCKNGMNFHYDDAGIDINCLGVGDFGDLSIIEDTLALPLVSLNEMPSDDYLLKDDDIVFVRSNGNKALVGRSLAVYPGDVLTTFSGFCIRYRKNTDEILVPYLLRVLKSDSIRKKMAGRGANIQNLNQQILGTLIIPVPPMELQQKFAAFVAEVDKSKAAVQKALDETKLLFDSLMQEYFG